MSRAVGREGEEIVIQFLINKLWRVLEKNFVTRYGEIDIITRDPNNYLVFIEVKYYSIKSLKHPLEAIDLKKQNRLRKTAQYYLVKKNIIDSNCRFDVVTVARETQNISHYRNIL